MSANLTISFAGGSNGVQANGKTVVGTVSGGSGTGYAITNANGIVGQLTATSTALPVVSASILGAQITLGLGVVVGSGEAFAVDIATSATLVDSGGNTAQGQAGASATNSSAVTVTTYNVNHAAVTALGRLNADNGFGLRLLQIGSEVVAVLHGTDISAHVYVTGGTVDGSADGGSYTTLTPAALNQRALVPLLSGGSSAEHAVVLKGGSNNSYVVVPGSLRVSGGTGAIRAAGASDGEGYGPTLKIGDAAFLTSGDRGSLIVNTGTYSDPYAYGNYNGANTRTDAHGRVKGRGDTLKVWAYCNGNKIAWFKNNVRQGTVTLPNTGTFSLVTLGAADPSTDAVYGISAALSALTIIDAPMLVGSTAAFAASTPTAQMGIGGLGDSIMSGANSPGTEDSSLAHLSMIAMGTNRTPYNRGVGGEKIAAIKARTSDITSLNSVIDVAWMQAGINDLNVTTIGDVNTSGTFAGDYKLTLNQLIAGLTNGQFIVVFDPFSRTGSTPNDLAPIRSAIVAAVAACSDPARIKFAATGNWLCQNNGPSSGYTDPNGDMGVDGLHPVAAGYARAYPLELPYFVTGPSAPTSLVATALSTTSIGLTWTDTASDETGFLLEVSPNGSTSWTTAATPAANATSYTHTGRTPNTAYYYRLSAVNGSGSSDYATANTTTLALPAVSPSATPTSTGATLTANRTGGTSPYTYAWSGTGISFSNSAVANPTATVTAAGSYTAHLALTDADGNTASGDAAFTVTAVLSSIAVSPTNPTVFIGQEPTFTAYGVNQFGTSALITPDSWTTEDATTCVGGVVSPPKRRVTATKGAVSGSTTYTYASDTVPSAQ